MKTNTKNRTFSLVISIALLGFLMTGCMHQTADETDILKALAFCKERGGIKHIKIEFSGNEKAICTNGDSTYLDGLTLSPDMTSIITEK